MHHQRREIFFEESKKIYIKEHQHKKAIFMNSEPSKKRKRRASIATAVQAPPPSPSPVDLALKRIPGTYQQHLRANRLALLHLLCFHPAVYTTLAGNVRDRIRMNVQAERSLYFRSRAAVYRQVAHRFRSGHSSAFDAFYDTQR